MAEHDEHKPHGTSGNGRPAGGSAWQLSAIANARANVRFPLPGGPVNR